MSKTEEEKEKHHDGYGWRVYAGLAVSVLIVAVAPWLGAVPADTPTVFWRMRVPRIAAGFMAGSGLALSGMCYQGIFRNVLATPYTLGVSGGAALGVCIALKLQTKGAWLGVTGSAAFLGAIGAMALVGVLSRMRGRNGNVMLLAGVAVSFFFSSLIMFLQYIGTQGEVFQAMRWLMGSLDVYGYDELAVLAGLYAVGSIVVFMNLDVLNLLAVGDDFAASRGVSLGRSKFMIHLAVTLMVAGVVSVCGPIGFVGMVCPHIGRLLTGANHRRLAPVCAVFGGAFLVACDTVGRCVLAPVELPVGIVTALCGAPFFLWLLLKR